MKSAFPSCAMFPYPKSELLRVVVCLTSPLNDCILTILYEYGVPMTNTRSGDERMFIPKTYDE